MKVSFLSFLLMALGLIVACADRATAPYPTSVPPVRQDSALGTGDVFEVRVFGESTLSAEYQVGPEGSVNFPLIGEVAVAGMAPIDLEREIQQRLADGFIKNPQVSIVVKESKKKIHVLGQVRSPGTFQYTEDMSIVEAITRAGGFTAMAKKNSVRVLRDSAAGAETIVVAVEDISLGKAPKFYLRPGDAIFVPERMF